MQLLELEYINDMNKIKLPIDRESAYHFLKADFKSAYNSNGNNIELALAQVAKLRNVHISYVRSILFDYIVSITKKL